MSRSSKGMSLRDGVVTIGGLIISCAHKAASQFVTSSDRLKAYPHVLYASAHFFRPTLPQPVESTLEIKIKNWAKGSLTLHFELSQNEKACVSGYLMYALPNH